jgi:hypothetical protein
LDFWSDGEMDYWSGGVKENGILEYWKSEFLN